jgi:hypothetical protein
MPYAENAGETVAIFILNRPLAAVAIESYARHKMLANWTGGG